jgi:hypothetical protein
MSTVTAPEGYTVCRTSTRFEVINAGDTCVWNDMHLRKVSAAHAVEVNAPADRQSQYFVGHRSEVWQTFKRADTALQSNELAAITATEWRAPVELVSVALVSEISETELPFEPCEAVRLIILPRIDHEAEIVAHDGDGRWRVNATINGHTFEFIVFEHQIVKMQSYLVTGFQRLGVPDDGTFAILPKTDLILAHTPARAQELAKALHDSFYQIVTCMRMPQHFKFEPEFYAENGEMEFHA